MPVAPETAKALAEGVFELQRTVRALVRERGLGDVAGAERAVLRAVGDSGGRAVEIAGKLGVSAPVLSRRVAGLVEQGLVVRRVDPQDRRAQLLGLTVAGRARLAEVEEAWAALLLGCLQGWEEAEAGACGSSIRRLAEALRRCAQRARPGGGPPREGPSEPG